jgi:hypothetical protein
LENEQSEQLELSYTDTFGDSQRDVPSGLPLYESARNDGAPGNTKPKYAGTALPEATINALTKACSSDDFNHNGVPDVHESAESAPLIGQRNQSARMAEYYREYAKFSYFFELHDGVYEAPTQGKPFAAFRIRERPRRDADSTRIVPVTYPADQDAYSTQCARHIDSAYQWQAGTPGSPARLLSPNTLGADLAHVGNLGWAGMTHHSQYKCVEVVTQDKYDAYTQGSAASAALYPEVVVMPSARAVQRKNETGGLMPKLPWYPNVCTASAEPIADNGASEVFPNISCVARDDVPPEGTVAWMAVGFENNVGTSIAAAAAAEYTSYLAPGHYKRGCINECIDLPKYADRPATPTCTQCRVDLPYGEGEIITKNAGASPCADTDPAAGGVCNGAEVCGECAPDIEGCRREIGTDYWRCDASAHWISLGPRTSCGAACNPGEQRACSRCPGTTSEDGGETCGSDGRWQGCTGGSFPRFYRDVDGDGYGNAGWYVDGQCSAPSGYVGDASDCDDGRGDRHPGLGDTCGDGVDNDCSGSCDDGCYMTIYQKYLNCGDANCPDNMLTSDPGEGGYGAFDTIRVYRTGNPGTTDTPLVRCYQPASFHFTTIGDANCVSPNSHEGQYGFLLSGPHPNTHKVKDCYVEGQARWMEQAQLGEGECGGGPTPNIPWTTWGSPLGYAPTTECWGQ